jgi:hypothetical protein
MLLDVHRLLKKGGSLWISCPNSESALRSVFGRAWINWHIPFHIVHFSSQSLCNLLSEAGFKTVEEKQITPALWLTSSVISRTFAQQGKPTRQLRSLFLGFAVPFFKLISLPLIWVANRRGQGDCLINVAVAE